jgi:peptide deformylase
MILDLVPPNSEILFKKLPRFNFANPPADPIEIAKNLTETMISHKGLGLAANQVGLEHRVFVVTSNPVICCFNPIIVDETPETNTMEEGCLSVPGMVLKIKRPNGIRIRYTQPNGETVTKVYQGYTARIMCHEYDHLEGILFTKRASKVHLAIAQSKMKAKI